MSLPYVIVGDAAFPLHCNMMRPYPGRNLPGLFKSYITALISEGDFCFVEDHAIFNYHLSRARRVIENSFGILAARWRILRRPIIAQPEKAKLYIQASIALHNFLRTVESSVYCPPGFIDSEDGTGNVLDGRWRADVEGSSGMLAISHTGSNRYVNNVTP